MKSTREDVGGEIIEDPWGAKNTNSWAGGLHQEGRHPAVLTAGFSGQGWAYPVGTGTSWGCGIPASCRGDKNKGYGGRVSNTYEPPGCIYYSDINKYYWNDNKKIKMFTVLHVLQT